ncbi:hypothetical protein [Catenulispora subtropica]|uniref:Lipoprotein n=1 Tax=Catenulispora subtropica TaxID=450798 RepID=A0ABN2QVT9_9ACTN
MRTRPILAASGSALLFACGGTVAHAGDGGGGGLGRLGGVGTVGAALPASGTAFSVVEDGDMVMECDGVVHRFEVRGAGRLRVGNRIAGATPTAVVSTDAEQLTGYDADLGTVTVTEKAPVLGEIVAPAEGRPYPAAESFAQDLTVAMEHSPCRGGRPAAYASKTAFPLLNTDLTAFPPRNAVYLLTDPVELVDVTDPSAPSFTLTAFPVTVSRTV